MSGPIATAVTTTVKLQVLADQDNIGCDFHAWWAFYAFDGGKVLSHAHEAARRRDEQVKLRERPREYA